MTFGISAAVMAGASVIGGGLSYMGASKAADAQKEAAANSIAAQKDMYNVGREDLAPYREGGITAQNQLMTLFGLGGDTAAPNYGKYAKDFSMSDFTADPGYQFRLDEGIKALNASAAARGGALSGANVKGAMNYGQNAASAEYTNAYNRYNSNRAAQLDPLYKLYAGGQAAASGSAAAANNLGTNIGNTITNAGAAEAAGYVAGGTAINSTISSLGNQYLTNQKNAAASAYDNNLLMALQGRNMSSTSYGP
jgi:hypothetical protein